MKKYSLYCLPVLCSVISPVFADQAGDSQQAPQAIKEITPPAYPLVKRSADPFLTAEYIYWRADLQGLDFAVTGLAPGLTNFHGEGKVHKPHFGYDSGFKVGFGLKFRHDSWDMLANYTWLFTDDNHDNAHRKSGQSMQNTWAAGIDGSAFPAQVHADIEKLSERYAMHFNVLDLEMGRNYFISPRLTLRPHFGLKLAWIDQDVEMKLRNINAAALGTVVPNANTYKLDQDMFGVGIRCGFNTAWFMWNKWSIFGNFAAAALYSDFDVKQKSRGQRANGSKYNVMNFDVDTHTVTPVLEFALGLRYETDFYRNNYQFMIQAGWEEQIWFNENQFSNLSNGPTGNLTLEGLTVKTGFSF